MNTTDISYDQLAIPEVQHFDLDKHKIAYREMGEGETIYMLPSWPANSIEYIPLMNLLSKNYHCIAIDFPHWTGHSKTNKGKLIIDDYVEIARRFYAEKINTKTNLIGYSFSVPIATLFESLEPDAINKTILVSGFINGKDIFRRYPNLIRAYSYLKTVVPEKMASSIVRSILFRTYKETVYYKQYKDAPLFQEFFEMITRLEFKKALNSIMDTIHRDYTEVFVKTYESNKPLLLWAEKDPDFIRTAMAQLDDMICTDDYTVRGTDHNHLAFDVVKSAELIEKFLSKD
ncbi:hypothetical protein GF389_04930 [Candidatus Dojkabacteria bacterium]|nr:hypothetical protein [Candidatus Dojkabacteria bacterium]